MFAQGNKGERPVAIVNGVEIPYSSYERSRLTRLHNLGKQLKDTATLNAVETDAIFLSLIDAELTRQEAAKRGITVTRKQAIELLVANPPQYLRDVFVGAYDPKIMRDVILNPKRILDFVNDPRAPKKKIVNDWKADIEHLLEYYQGEETRRRLIDTLFADKPLTDADIKHRYFAERVVVEGSVLRVLHSTVPDSLVPVSDAEVREWYNTHKEDYRIPESRLVNTIIIPVVPSSADSAKQQTQMKAAQQMVESAPIQERLERVEELIENLLPNRAPVDRAISPKEFTDEIKNDLITAHKGELLGPYPIEKESLLLYVADEFPSEDTLVRARQILLQVTPETTEEGKKELWRIASLLRDSIDNEAEFIEAAQYFNNDPKNIGGDGDLGYAARGLYVEEFDSALFAAPVGVPVGPIKTRFGYHLIWVIDKQARNFNLRELRFPLVASKSVQQTVMKDAEEYARLLRSGGYVDSMLVVLKDKYPRLIIDSGSVLKRLEPYGDVLATGEFAFNANVGDVGVIPLPYDRIAVMELLHVWDEGIPAFDDIIAYPDAHARRKKQIDSLESRLHNLTEQIKPTMLLGEIRNWAPMSESFVLQRQPIMDMPDEDPTLLDSLVAVTKSGEVTGPVRGVHGLYFLLMSASYGPSEANFQRDKAQYSREYEQKYRKQLIEKALLNARHYATVKDLRHQQWKVVGKGS